VDDVMVIPKFSAPYSSLPPGAGNAGPWNWEDLTLPSLQYANNGNGKPGMQYYYMNNRDQACGTIGSPGVYNNGNNSWPTPQAWTTFLNYYLWMQSCVDYQVGRVLGYVTQSKPGLSGYPTFWGNTIVVFTSDHGEYGGSHGLHAKGGALYDEAMNVPLYISYPQMRNGTESPRNGSIPYVCSSVDLLPYLYTAALGNHSWRNNNNDMVAYLNQRESIQDAIMTFMSSGPNVVQERRISSIPLLNNACPAGGCSGNWQYYQPFVLHSADDFAYAIDHSGNYTPSHALAFRTVDITDSNTQTAPFSGQNAYGGGKLGIYSYWDTCANETYPANNATNQYEFYNYSDNAFARNPQEVGNQYFESSSNSNPTTLAQKYQNDFFDLGSPAGINVMTEFYDLASPGSYGADSATAQVTAAIPVAMQNYMEYLWCSSQTSNGNNTAPTDCGNTSPKNSTTCPPFAG
jgi:hypothetical protein